MTTCDANGRPLPAMKTRLEREVVSGSGVFEKMAHVADIDFPGSEHLVIEVPSRDYDSGKVEVPYGIMNQDAQVTLNGDPADYAKMKEDHKMLRTWRYRFITPTEPETAYEFCGRPKTWKPGRPVDGNISTVVTFYVEDGSESEYELTN